MNIKVKNFIRLQNLILILFFLSLSTSLFSYIRNYPIKNQKKYMDILEKVQSGKLVFFYKATYSEVKDLIFFILAVKSENQTILDFFSGKTFDSKIQFLNDIILGIKNKDPRVRLISINFLKDLFHFFDKLKNSEEFQSFLKKKATKEERLSFQSFDKKIALEKSKKRYEQFLFQIYQKVSDQILENFYLETVLFKRHCMINSLGMGEFRVPHMEVKDFLFELVRFLVDKKIKEEKLKPIDFENLNPIIFYSLTEPIKNESHLDLPIYKMENNIEILIHSLKHPKEKVKKRSAEFLSLVYHSNYTNNQIKNRIELLQENFPLLKEAIQTYHKRKAINQEMDDLCPDYLTPSEEERYATLLSWLSDSSLSCP